MRLTSVILPKTFNVNDMRLQVRLCRLHIHIVSHVVHAVFKAAVLTVCALQVRLPRSSNRVLSLLSFWEFTSHSVKKIPQYMMRQQMIELLYTVTFNIYLSKYPFFPLPSWFCPPQTPWEASLSSPFPHHCADVWRCSWEQATSRSPHSYTARLGSGWRTAAVPQHLRKSQNQSCNIHMV